MLNNRKKNKKISNAIICCTFVQKEKKWKIYMYNWQDG